MHSLADFWPVRESARSSANSCLIEETNRKKSTNLNPKINIPKSTLASQVFSKIYIVYSIFFSKSS